MLFRLAPRDPAITMGGHSSLTRSPESGARKTPLPSRRDSYGIGRRVTVRGVRSKVMTSLTPRLRQLARWQRSRAPSMGYCSWSCLANVTSSSSSGHTCTRDRATSAIAASSASTLATGRYAWTNSCKTSVDVHRGVRFPLHMRKNSRAILRSGCGRPTAYTKTLVSTKIMFRQYRFSAIR